MVKKVKQEKLNVEEQQQNIQNNKKPLRKYLPYQKYVNLSIKKKIKKLQLAKNAVQLNKTQIKQAVKCLIKFVEENANPADLLGKQEYIYVEIDMSRIPEEYSVRPIQIELPFPIYSQEFKSRYSIIISDENEQKFTQIINTINTPILKQIISYKKIKKNYMQVKDKRELLAANDLFFCDWKIYNLLRHPLGKLFYQQKKFPFPISCEGEIPQHLKGKYKDYESYINGLAGSTYTMLGNGPVYALKVGRTRMKVGQLVKNIQAGIYRLIANIIDGKVKAKHVRQIKIKTYNSPSLPIYCYLTKKQCRQYFQQNCRRQQNKQQ